MKIYLYYKYILLAKQVSTSVEASINESNFIVYNGYSL